MNPEFAKQESQRFFQEHDIAWNDSLPLLESEAELSPQGQESVAKRAVIQTYLIGISFGQGGADLIEPLRQYGLENALSNHELKLLELEAFSEQQKMNASWLAESLQAFGWCLNFATLDPFSGSSDDLVSCFPEPFTDPANFISGVKLRPFSDLYLQTDLYYRLHSYSVSARISNQECLVNETLIKQRRKVLEWTIGVESDWDNISSDT